MSTFFNDGPIMISFRNVIGNNNSKRVPMVQSVFAHFGLEIEKDGSSIPAAPHSDRGVLRFNHIHQANAEVVL